MNSKANALDKLNRKKEALEVYEKLNEIKPENAVYMLNYAVCLNEMDNLEKSEEILAKAQQLYETQKNDLDEETKTIFDNNVAKLREQLDNKKNK